MSDKADTCKQVEFWQQIQFGPLAITKTDTKMAQKQYQQLAKKMMLLALCFLMFFDAWVYETKIEIHPTQRAKNSKQ